MNEPVYEPGHFYYIMYYGKNFANGFGRVAVLDLLNMDIIKYYRTIRAEDTTHYFVRADYDLDTDDSEL